MSSCCDNDAVVKLQRGRQRGPLYGLSLYAVSRGPAVKARVALFKGGLIFLAACGVAAQIVYKLFVPTVPVFEVMAIRLLPH